MFNRFVSKFVSLLLLTTVLALGVNAEAKYNFYGTQYSDWAVFSFPSAGGQLTWNILKNENPTPTTGQTFMRVPWGQSASEFVPNQGDWDGNGVADLAVYRDDTATPINSYLIQLLNANGAAGGQQYATWGSGVGVDGGDSIGAEGDYDGDGKMDYTITRDIGANTHWFVLQSSNNTLLSFPWGLSSASDIALPGADYNGDGKDDPCVARIGGTGAITFFAGQPFTSPSIISVTFGNFNTDFIIAGGDYDGDNKADFTVWRGFGNAVNGHWYTYTSAGNVIYHQRFGIPSATDAARDQPLRGVDFDGDGKTDVAVYRRSNQTFYVNRSDNSGVQSQVWGAPAGNAVTAVASFGVF